MASLAEQSAYPTQTPEADWYQIEYILFKHLSSDTQPLRFEDVPYPKQQNKQYIHLINAPYPASSFQFTRLSGDDTQLTDTVKKLSRSRTTEILDHGAWQQILPAESSPPPLRISRQIDHRTKLFGEIQLTRSRFIHAQFSVYLANTVKLPFSDTKTWFLQKTPRSVLELILPVSDNFHFTHSSGDSELFTNINYLSESRRIKQGELHYLDHPVLSAIITVKQVDPPANAYRFGPNRY